LLANAGLRGVQDPGGIGDIQVVLHNRDQESELL
jgi:hypothetical protein